MWTFWRAWQSSRLVDFALSGALLGLTLYTHIPSRLLPFVLLGFLIVMSLLRCVPGKNYRRVWLGAAIMFAYMLVMFAPLGMFFVDNPGLFLQRTGTTSIFSGGWDATLGNFGNNAVKVVRMFMDQGDLNPPHNIPGRPALEWLTAIGFWIGVVIAFFRVTTKPVYVLLWFWLGANLAMTLFSTDAPHFHRSLGAMPAIVLLAAGGLMQLRDRFLPRLSVSALVAIVVLAGGIQTYRDYFDVWGPNRETFFGICLPHPAHAKVTERQVTDAAPGSE